MTMKTAAHTAGAVEGAVDARLAAAALWALNGPGPLDVRTGVVYAPGNPMQVLGTSATSPWAVTVNPGHVVGSKGITNGPYYGANDGLTTVNLTVPPASNSRIDVVYAMQMDLAAILNADGSTAAVLSVAVGTPGASPAVPAVPVGAVALYTVQIASTATAGTSGAGVTITPVFNWTTTHGDPIPVRNQAERDALSLYDDCSVYRLDLHLVEMYLLGTGWSQSAPKIIGSASSGSGWNAYVSTLSRQNGIGTFMFRYDRASGVAAQGEVFATLPSGFWPGVGIFVPCTLFNGTWLPGLFALNPGGSLTINLAGLTSVSSIAGSISWATV
jgi:hypothetical protein